MRVWGDGHVIAGYRGSEVPRGLKDQPAIAGIPVAILSAEASPAIIRDMRTRGVIAYPPSHSTSPNWASYSTSSQPGTTTGPTRPPDGTDTMNGVVLYIDDNQDNIFLLQRMFKHRRPDIQLHTAMTGRDGIKAAIDGQPALILLDNRLPDTNGEQVLLQLATAPPPPRSRSSSSAATRTR